VGWIGEKVGSVTGFRGPGEADEAAVGGRAGIVGAAGVPAKNLEENETAIKVINTTTSAASHQ
jgi:hypothetical protein